MIGFDYTERIAPAALKAAGCSVVFRYTTWSGWAKSLTPTEADELHAAGIPVVANFESTADRMKGGAAAGRADALEAAGHLVADHLPADLKVWFSADWDVQPSEVPLVLTYLGAASDVLGGVQKVGLYGGLRAVKAAADAGFGIWQTIAWSGGQWDSRAAARQTGEQRTVGGFVVDVNEIIDLAALGAWGGPTSGGSSMATIPDSIAHHFAGLDLSNDFPPNGTWDPNTAQIWADARAEAAYRQAALNGQMLSQLLARPAAPVVDVAALSAALVPHLNNGATADQIAQAVVAHLGLQVVAK